MPMDRWRVSDMRADGGTAIELVCERCGISRLLEEGEDPDEVVETHAELGCHAAYYVEVGL